MERSRSRRLGGSGLGLAICKEIVARGLFFEWACESRVDTMDFEMLRWLRKAGCVKIYYGLESGSPDVLVTMKKGLTPEKILAGAKLNREVGMYFKYFILYGFPNEKKKDHKLTEEIVRLADQLDATLSALDEKKRALRETEEALKEN